MPAFIRLSLVALALSCVTAPAALSTDQGRAIAVFEPSFEVTGGPTIDYSIWTNALSNIVYNVGYSDRLPMVGQPIITGTRINTANDSRYRYEANRVIYHLLTEEHDAAISSYRAELSALPSQLDFSRLSSDEQLAFWLNLYTVIVIDEINAVYPVQSIERLANNRNDPLFDKTVVTIDGVDLSLNDIQYNIVYAHWDNPLVMYGFFNGSIGAPRINREAYTGENVWELLRGNAREFVNALRGVEITRRTLRISEQYNNARDYFFPNWPSDVRAHLRQHANDSVYELVQRNNPVRANVREWSIADMLNGSYRCGGGITAVNSFGSNGRITGSESCVGLPDNARTLTNYVIERRIERLRERGGRVTINDILDGDTDDLMESDGAEND